MQLGWYLIGVLSATVASAETLSFQCEWQLSEPGYLVRFDLDLESLSATRDDSTHRYDVIRVTEHGVWLSSRETSPWIAAMTIFERSSVGGSWTDTWLWSNGDAKPTVGGYCVELR
jgi:hypothetical protein